MSEYYNLFNVNDLQRFLKSDRIPRKSESVIFRKHSFFKPQGIAIMLHLLRWCGFGVCLYTVARPALHLQHSGNCKVWV